MEVLQGRRLIRPVAKKWRGGAHIERRRELDVFFETPVDQLLARDRSPKDSGEVWNSCPECVARYPRLSGKKHTGRVEDGPSAEQILDGGPQAAVVPSFTRRHNADHPRRPWRAPLQRPHLRCADTR
jgi:hypothetical protein